MPRLFDSKYIDNDFSLYNNRAIDQIDIKKATKELCRSYKNGTISEASFHNIIENLLAFFIERSFENKLSSKAHRIDDKLFRHNI